MKAIVRIELSDEQRTQLKTVIDGKATKKMASRADVVALCEQHISGLVNTITDPEEAIRTTIMTQHAKPGTGFDIYKADPADIPLMAQPDNPGYVRGWNLVKRS